jgi:lipopolysaccharide/colanic/teichoic acid biosynthesis glycosyltransferase
MKMLTHSRDLDRELVGFVDDYARIGENVACRVAQYGSRIETVPVLGRGADLPRLIDDWDIDELFVTTTAGDLEQVRRTTEHHRHVRAAFLPELGHVRAEQLQIQQLGALPLLRAIEVPTAGLYCAAKRILDFTLAALAISLLSPLWLFIAAAIKLDSPGPVIFRQVRIGEGGKPFTLYKFRSLHTNADPYSKSNSVLDSRSTRVGRILRLTGLDEVAQLLNVLKGDMSLVGPRPEMPFVVDEYDELERARLSVKPGITGVWQLSPDREGSAIHENIEYDLYYISRRGLFLDLLILLETVFFTTELLFAAARRLLTESDSTKCEALSPVKTVPMTLKTQAAGGRVVLVADQRRNGLVHEPFWNATLHSAIQIAAAEDMSLDIVAARSNVSVIDGLVERRKADHVLSFDGIRYVPYEDKHQVVAAIRDAALVLTDLPLMEKLAHEHHVSVVRLRERMREATVTSEPRQLLSQQRV